MTDTGYGIRDTGASDSDAERDTPMTGIYVAVIAVEALIITALWALGRLYS